MRRHVWSKGTRSAGGPSGSRTAVSRAIGRFQKRAAVSGVLFTLGAGQMPQAPPARPASDPTQARAAATVTGK